MSSSAIHSNSSAAKGSISFCSNSFPKPQNDHDLVLLMTAEIKKLHTEMKKLKSELKAVQLEKDASKQELFDLFERIMTAEKNAPQHSEAHGHKAISFSTTSSPKGVSPPSSQGTPAPAAAQVHDAHASKPPTETVAETKRAERERLDFIAGCDRKDRSDGQSFFIGVDEIAQFKRDFAAREAKGAHKWKPNC